MGNDQVTVRMVSELVAKATDRYIVTNGVSRIMAQREVVNNLPYNTRMVYMTQSSQPFDEHQYEQGVNDDMVKKLIKRAKEVCQTYKTMNPGQCLQHALNEPEFKDFWQRVGFS